MINPLLFCYERNPFPPYPSLMYDCEMVCLNGPPDLPSTLVNTGWKVKVVSVRVVRTATAQLAGLAQPPLLSTRPRDSPDPLLPLHCYLQPFPTMQHSADPQDRSLHAIRRSRLVAVRCNSGRCPLINIPRSNNNCRRLPGPACTSPAPTTPTTHLMASTNQPKLTNPAQQPTQLANRNWNQAV